MLAIDTIARAVSGLRIERFTYQMGWNDEGGRSRAWALSLRGFVLVITPGDSITSFGLQSRLISQVHFCYAPSMWHICIRIMILSGNETGYGVRAKPKARQGVREIV